MNNSSSSFLSFADHNNHICFVFNITKNCFTYTNQAFKSFFKLESKVATPKLLFHMVCKEDTRFLKSVYVSLKVGVFKDKIEFKMLLPDKKEYSLQLSILLEEEVNNERFITGCMEDISISKAHEAVLNEMSNKKNAILNILSHDLAGPLGSIKNFTHLLSKKNIGNEDPQVQRIITSIEDISTRSIKLIQDFIQLEFLETVGVDMVKGRVNLVEVLGLFMQQYLETQSDRKIAFHFNSSHPEIYAQIDENKFIQVINNLISNSLKFTPDNGTITVSLEEKEKTVLIKVADNGVGIPKKHHATLFEKFNSARRPGLKGEPSVGLGMSIIKTIVQWHKGKIWFESEEEKGTAFYIEIDISS